MVESLIMLVGVAITYKLGIGKFAKLNGKLQILCTCSLIFIMGVKLGGRENLWEELSTLGIQSLWYAVIPIVFSILVVYVLSKETLEKR